VLSNLRNAGYSSEWLKQYESNKYFLCDPTKRARLAGHDFFKWSYVFGKAASEAEKSYIEKAREYNICQGITVGSRSSDCDRVTWFSFLGAELEKNRRDQMILQYIAPYLHEAICAGILSELSFESSPSGPANNKTAKPLLSDRETEVLTWAMAGKTNWEISVILNISERTVKFHVQNLMAKLQASSRAHAVAIALGQGLICN
jgi:DNA-binding CsgD family transcriptional regulator